MLNIVEEIREWLVDLACSENWQIIKGKAFSNFDRGFICVLVILHYRNVLPQRQICVLCINYTNCMRNNSYIQ